MKLEPAFFSLNFFKVYLDFAVLVTVKVAV